MSTKLTVPNNIRVKINGNSCVKTTLAPSTAASATTATKNYGNKLSVNNADNYGNKLSVNNADNYGNKLSVNAEVVCDLPTPIITNGENNITNNASNGEKKVCL